MTLAKIADESCVEFQARMPQLFESESEVSKQAHLDSCENCAELVRDLLYIAEQAKFFMPIRDPAPAVWEKINSALQTGDEGGKPR